jgi:hypothetical protein
MTRFFHGLPVCWLLGISLVCSLPTSAQKTVRSFIFGNSLVLHELQQNPTPSQESSMPHWCHFLAKEAGQEYAVSGQYGFLPQPVQLPPRLQWFFDSVAIAWNDVERSFAEANFSNIVVTPANFIQWQAPTEDYPTDPISPIEATAQIFDWCLEQNDSLTLYIYEGWPDMSPYLNGGFPPTASEWQAYNTYLMSNFHDWFLTYQDALVNQFPEACVKMIPVGPIIGEVLSRAPFQQIPLTELYEDDAPHGTPSLYFLTAMISYMSQYQEKAPPNYRPNALIHPIIRDHYAALVDLIWAELNDFSTVSGTSRVFCGTSTQTVLPEDHTVKVHFYPNPTDDFLNIASETRPHELIVLNAFGQVVRGPVMIRPGNQRILLGNLPSGLYFFIGKDHNHSFLYRKSVQVR